MDLADINGTSRLQDIVDEASQALGRPVAIDDRHHRLLVYSEHPTEELDPIRLASILRQPASSELLEWLWRHGVRSSIGPVRVPANESLGLEARVCVPIRCETHLLGFFWLTDRDESIDPHGLQLAAAAAEEAGIALYRDMMMGDLERGREREFIRDLLSENSDTRASALEQLAQFDLFVSRGPVVVIVVRLLGRPEDVSPETIRLSVDAALMRVRRQLAPKHGVHLLRGDHGVMLVSLYDPWVRLHGRFAFADRVHAEIMQNVAPQTGLRCIVALGGEATDLEHSAISHRQALRACDVTEAVPSFGDVVDWDKLGVYRALAEFPVDRLAPDVIHPSLSALMEDEQAHWLIRTVECYLDNAGDAQVTARELFLHRTSLYHRLRRFERAAGLDLANGADRLMLHLSLKLARLQGRSWTSLETQDPVTDES